MKQLKFIILIIALISLYGTKVYAHDISAPNKDGISIFYNWTDNRTKLQVTYQGMTYEHYKNEYSGDIVIPESVEYAGNTYMVTSIGDFAFAFCSNVTSVVIPSSIVFIGTDAFYGTSWLDAQPDGLVYVGRFAYKYKGVMTENAEIEIKDGTIGICDAFYKCSGLAKISLPNSVTYIGNSAFSHCDNLTTINIPNSVTSIGEYAFAYCSKLTSLTIPISVSIIGKNAFYYCDGLNSVTVQAVPSSIGSYIFSGCSNLKEVTFDCNMVLSLFKNIGSIEKVILTNNVKNIDNDAFLGCEGLTCVEIFDMSNWCNLDFKSPQSNPLYYAKHLYLNGKEINSLVIPNGITSISKYAFYNCNLKSVILSSSVTSIGKNSFYNTNLKKTIWLTNTPPIGYENLSGSVNYVSNEQYYNISNKQVYPFLSSYFDADGIRYVPVSPSERTCDAIDCLYDESVENINIGKTITNKGITLTVKKVNPYTCYDNNIIKDVNLSFDGDIGEYAFYGCQNIEKASISNNGSVGGSAFKSCSALITADISNAGDIGELAFNYCTSLISAKIKNQGSIGQEAFCQCYSLETAELGEEVTSIGSGTFKDCSKLQSIVVPDAVTTIGSNAFLGCSSMTSAKIGSGLKVINEKTFSNCSSLKELTIGSQVKTINQYAFSNCLSLLTITIPQAVTEIGNSVFYGCSGLKEVIMSDSETNLKLGSNTKNSNNYGNPLFSDCPLDSVYIGRDISYSTNSNYGYSPFYHNTSLRAVKITDKETEISGNEFYGCTNLQRVIIGDGVTDIGNWAFSGCSSLKYFAFGTHMKNIGQEAFSDCTAVVEISSKSATPPTTGTQALDDINKWECNLIVPKGCLAKYQAANQWKDFFFIKEGDYVGRYNLLYIVDNEEYKNYVLEYGESIIPEAEPVKEGYTFSGWSELPETMPANDVTITGSFTLNKYKLTYTVDGVEYKAFEFEYGSAITPEAEPTKEGYSFSGWSEIPDTMPANDITVMGSFTINKYKLTYVIDGEEYKSNEIEYGTSITFETEPTKEGYTFSGWSEISETMPANDVTITGSFTLNKYKLTYTVDGVEYKAFEFEYGSAITPEAEPTKEGYSFSGWSEIPDTMPANDITVMGSFTINKYKLTYVVDGEEYKTYEIEYGTSITLENEPTKEGYTFSGWSEIPDTMPANDIAVTGTFTINKYKLIYMVDGAEYKSLEIEYGASVTSEAAPTKEGYIFSGWSEIPDIMPAYDLTVTGTFSADESKYAVRDGIKYKKTAANECEVISNDGCSGDVVIPETITSYGKEYIVTSIGGSAFKGCYELTSMIIPNSITFIGDSAFAKCHNLASVDIPNSVYHIGEWAFFDTGLTSVTIPNGIKTLEKSIFNGCDNLSSVTLPNSVTTIGYKAFYRCLNLESINIPNGIMSIGELAFWECRSLTSITIPNSVTSIGANAFDGEGENIPNIQTITSLIENPFEIYGKSSYKSPNGKDYLGVFNPYTFNNATLYVPKGTIDKYKAINGWKDFFHIDENPNETGIQSLLFDNDIREIHSLNGEKITSPTKGINIIKMKDGTVKKVLIK